MLKAKTGFWSKSPSSLTLSPPLHWKGGRCQQQCPRKAAAGASMNKAGCKLLGSMTTINNAFAGED